MKNKKMLLIITIMCLALGMAACGDKTVSKADVETQSGGDFEKTSGESFGVEEGKKTTTTKDGTYEAKQEIIDAKWDSGLIQINDKILQYPFRLSDWMELGFDYDIGELSKDYLWAPESMFSINLLVDGEEFSSLSFINSMDSYETVETIDPLIVESGYILNMPKKYTLYFPGGLTWGDSFEDVQKVFGKPNNGLTYQYGSLNSVVIGDVMYGYYINISQNDQTINNIQIGKNINACNMEDLTTITYENVENVHVSEVHNVSFSWFPESMEEAYLPSDHRAAKSVLNYNDQTYFVDYDFRLISQRYAGDNDYFFYGDPLFDETDENGMRRRLYNNGENYLAVCSTDLYILEAHLNIVNATDTSEDALVVLQDFAIEFTKSIQY